MFPLYVNQSNTMEAEFFVNHLLSSNSASISWHCSFLTPKLNARPPSIRKDPKWFPGASYPKLTVSGRSDELMAFARLCAFRISPSAVLHGSVDRTLVQTEFQQSTSGVFLRVGEPDAHLSSVATKQAG